MEKEARSLLTSRAKSRLLSEFGQEAALLHVDSVSVRILVIIEELDTTILPVTRQYMSVRHPVMSQMPLHSVTKSHPYPPLETWFKVPPQSSKSAIREIDDSVVLTTSSRDDKNSRWSKRLETEKIGIEGTFISVVLKRHKQSSAVDLHLEFISRHQSIGVLLNHATTVRQQKNGLSSTANGRATTSRQR
ncbi:hypothetical protein YC2023_075101 [Brassica napus]